MESKGLKIWVQRRYDISKNGDKIQPNWAGRLKVFRIAKTQGVGRMWGEVKLEKTAAAKVKPWPRVQGQKGVRVLGTP